MHPQGSSGGNCPLRSLPLRYSAVVGTLVEKEFVGYSCGAVAHFERSARLVPGTGHRPKEHERVTRSVVTPSAGPARVEHGFETFIIDVLEAHLIRPDHKDEKKRFWETWTDRQWVESVFDTMEGQLTLMDHSGRTIAGVYP